MAPSGAGAAEFDEGTPYPVIRSEREFMWPTPDFVGGLRRIVDERAIEVVLFGAVAPLSVVGPQLARSGTPYLVAAHGFDHWLATTPGTHALTRYATSRAARVPVMCSEFVARTVRTAVPAHVPVSVLYPGADLEVFRPDLDADDLRERHGLGDRPVVVCVSRLVRRKGQDVLIRAMGLIRQRVPDAVLLIVGGGPDEARLHGLAAALAPKGSVVFAGQVSEEELPRYYAVGDVFAMPCRTRLAGFELEGWGNVFIEAAACGKPVVVGDSGGAGESLVHGETGLLVNGRNVRQVAASVGDLLADPGWASELGKEGRARVERCHSWTTIAERLATWIHQASG
jgi:phosphatidylinositol alpha-1,6-mannosyltransferase